MAKKGYEQPDKKQIEKSIKNVDEVRKQLHECNKQLKGVAEIAKELDKMVG